MNFVGGATKRTRGLWTIYPTLNEGYKGRYVTYLSRISTHVLQKLQTPSKRITFSPESKEEDRDSESTVIEFTIGVFGRCDKVKAVV